jgi:hypothetical protein
MTNRYCHGCDAEVEIHDGVCLLGHSPRATTPDGPLAHVRLEVEQAFAEAQTRLQTLTVEPPSTVHLDGPEVSILQRAPRNLGPPLMPPPPPPAPPATSAYQREWDLVDSSGRGSAADPIANFAPPARVDWGPDRSFSLFKLRGMLSQKA